MPATDSLIVLGYEDEKLTKFFSKMGYSLVSRPEGSPIPSVLSKNLVDCIIIDSRAEFDCQALCEYLRTEEATRRVPIVYLGAKREEIDALQKAHCERIEFLSLPYSVGQVMSRVAMQIRLRKMAGFEDRAASLGEVVAAQRDVTARITKEIEEARGIQEGLLPKILPSDSRYEIAATYQPLEEVGGDWYYAVKEKSGKLSVQIADVTGHGLSAAFIGSMTKLAFSAAGKELPHERISEMNRLMSPQLPEGRFVTISSYLYDPSNGHLTLARAGHPPGLVLNRKTGQVTSLFPDGFAVGFFDEGKYEFAEATLEPGDVALVFTDGISEAQDRSSEFYGVSRLSSALAKTAPTMSAAQVLQSVMEDFLTFTDGRKFKDDVTLVVLKRT